MIFFALNITKGSLTYIRVKKNNLGRVLHTLETCFFTLVKINCYNL